MKFKVLTNIRLHKIYNEVRVNASPDLFIEERGKKKILKFNPAKYDTGEDERAIITQAMYEAQEALQLGLNAKDVQYIDVRNGIIYNFEKRKALKPNEILKACERIAKMWNNI